MKKLIAGNWKMNLSLDEAKKLIADLVNGIYEEEGLLETCEFLVCPPSIYLPTIRHALVTTNYMTFGAQDCSEEENGARTGDISAQMLLDSKCSHVIAGHSERRQFHSEDDALVAAKVKKIHEKGMIAIICVGEQESERDAGKEQDVVAKQLGGSMPDTATAENTVIAYEPVWAIGTGKTATPEDAGAMHGFIREQLKNRVDKPESLRILYGGSMKPGNAGELLATPNIDGGLIGGASLTPEDFLGIARAA